MSNTTHKETGAAVFLQPDACDGVVRDQRASRSLTTPQSGTAATKATFFSTVDKRYSRDWLAYYGSWFVKLHDDSKKGTMLAIRAMRYPDDSKATVQQINVYERQETPTCKPREVDQFFQTPFTYDAAINAASKAPYNTKTHDRNMPQLTLALGEVEQEAYATLPMFVAGEVVSTSVVANMTESVYRYRFIPSEFFIADGPHRWAVCVVYDAEATGGPLILVNMAREIATRLDPEEPGVLYKHKELLAPIRPSLEPDPEEWVPAAAKQGVVQAIVVDPATGDLVRLPPSPCTFRPPTPADTTTHHFMLLPDAAYCILPISINGVRERRENSF